MTNQTLRGLHVFSGRIRAAHLDKTDTQQILGSLRLEGLLPRLLGCLGGCLPRGLGEFVCFGFLWHSSLLPNSTPMKKTLFALSATLSMAPSIVGAANPAEPVKDIRIVMHTDKGDIHATLFASKAPVTVANFLNLARRGYYDGVTFHRVIPNFMIQGGDPTGTGMGGPGYRFADEFAPGLRHDRAGLFSMANAGPGTNGSQFFITHVPTPHLDGKHAIFGSVDSSKDQDVVNAIRKDDKIKGIEIVDSPESLFAAESAQIAAWNKVLSK